MTFRMIMTLMTTMLIALASTACGGVPSITVTAAQYGSDWPLSVSSAEVFCEDNAVWVMVDGRVYPVNGLAHDKFKDAPNIYDLENIWLDDPEYLGKKKGMVLTGLGLRLCNP